MSNTVVLLPTPLSLTLSSSWKTKANSFFRDVEIKNNRLVISMPKISTKRSKLKKAAAVMISMPPAKLEIFKSLEPWAEENILPLLKPVEESWQPQDFLPDPSMRDEDEYIESVREIRERSSSLPDEFYVCLAGNMITEEALPTYQSVFNTFEGVRDESGASPTPWARWIRQWSAEENRHGDLLNKYLWLTGRVDMRQVEKTVQYLIGAGMDIGTQNNPYLGFIYTSFQERATAIAHGNTARHAKHHGDSSLARICGTIAADEKRHEAAYSAVVAKLLGVDPDTTVLSLADMMQKRITMPALLMFDGEDRSLFVHYSAVAQKAGVYTTKDYADIVEHFVNRWEIEKLSYGLSGEGRRGQDYVCSLPERIRKTEDRVQSLMMKKKKKNATTTMVPFSWVFNRNVSI